MVACRHALVPYRLLVLRKNDIWLGVTALVGVAVFVYVQRDWFRPGPIQIFHRLSASSSTRADARAKQPAQTPTVVFGLDRKYKLKEVKVVAVAQLATNRYAHPLWHLVSDSNSIPVSGFNYGQHIRGMRPAAKRERPDPLQTNVTYRLLVETSRQKGQYDFTIGGAESPSP